MSTMHVNKGIMKNNSIKLGFYHHLTVSQQKTTQFLATNEVLASTPNNELWT